MCMLKYLHKYSKNAKAKIVINILLIDKIYI